MKDKIEKIIRKCEDLNKLKMIKLKLGNLLACEPQQLEKIGNVTFAINKPFLPLYLRSLQAKTWNRRSDLFIL